MTFKVVLVSDIEDKGEIVDITRTIGLPFTPFEGLRILADTLSPVVEVESVAWSIDGDNFICQVTFLNEYLLEELTEWWELL
jgi:hypothetical protein